MPLHLDTRLTKAEAAIDMANAQISAIQQSPNSDADTVAALQHLSSATASILIVLREWELKAGK